MDTSGSTRKQFVTKPESRPNPKTGDLNPSDLQLEAFNFCRDAQNFQVLRNFVSGGNSRPTPATPSICCHMQMSILGCEGLCGSVCVCGCAKCQQLLLSIHSARFCDLFISPHTHTHKMATGSDCGNSGSVLFK